MITRVRQQSSPEHVRAKYRSPADWDLVGLAGDRQRAGIWIDVIECHGGELGVGRSERQDDETKGGFLGAGRLVEPLHAAF
jgi:hypothetical protein